MFKQLKEKRGQTYDTPKLRLWARSMCNNYHDDMDDPPDQPPFQTPKKTNRLTETLTANVFSKSRVLLMAHLQDCHQVKQFNWVWKKYEQLRYFQQVFDDRILSGEEYDEKKKRELN